LVPFPLRYFLDIAPEGKYYDVDVNVIVQSFQTNIETGLSANEVPVRFLSCATSCDDACAVSSYLTRHVAYDMARTNFPHRPTWPGG
jgi:hypothetical protein